MPGAGGTGTFGLNGMHANQNNFYDTSGVTGANQ